MRITIGLTAIVASLALAACDQPPADRPSDGRADGSPIAEDAASPEPVAASLSGQDFANTLAAGDAFEIAAFR